MVAGACAVQPGEHGARLLHQQPCIGQEGVFHYIVLPVGGAVVQGAGLAAADDIAVAVKLDGGPGAEMILQDAVVAGADKLVQRVSAGDDHYALADLRHGHSQ